MTSILYPLPQFVKEIGSSHAQFSGLRVSGDDQFLSDLEDCFSSLRHMGQLCIAAPESGGTEDGFLPVRLERVREKYFDAIGFRPAAGRRPADHLSDERYEIVNEDGEATVRAAGTSGFRYAVVALVQLASGGRKVPQLRIVDGPRLAWRGLSLDVSRHFYPVSELKSFVDLLLWNRANVLHLHLTDNQAWRIEVEGFPDLTPEGSLFYTQQDLSELAEYARHRGVTLVPEVDMPGHVGSAMKRYPQISGGKTFDSDLLAHLTVDDSTARSLVEHSIASVARWNPSSCIHIGGDEALGMPEDQYRQALAFGVEQVERCGSTPITWQEGVHSEALPQDGLLQFWQSPFDAFDPEAAGRTFPEELQPLIPLFEASSKRAMEDSSLIADHGFGVIASPSDPVYLDRRYLEKSRSERQNDLMETVGFPAYRPLPLERVLQWSPWLDPVLSKLSLQGVEAALWSETIESLDDAALLLLPRFPVIAAAAWGSRSISNEEVARLLLAQSQVWERLGFGNWYRNETLFAYAEQ